MCISTPRGAYSPAAVSAHWTYRTHCHLCPTRYSFSPESSEAFEGEASCPRTHHLNNVPRLREDEHDISLKILHQAGFETARQAATSAERHALTIAPCPSLLYPLKPYIKHFNVHPLEVVFRYATHKFHWLKNSHRPIFVITWDQTFANLDFIPNIAVIKPANKQVRNDFICVVLLSSDFIWGISCFLTAS